MSAVSPERPRVLVVDDNRLLRELARDALANTARVTCCESGAAALAALEREPAELVVSDLTMPGLSGLELLERVRREHPGTDFVLLTANASIDSAVHALRMGASDYLIKPIQAVDLARVADRILSARAVVRENERLRDALGVVESCQTLLRCLDASEVYAVALDLILHALPRSRGIVQFRRTSVPMSDGLGFRGFSETDARQLRRMLVDDKSIDLDVVRELAVSSSGALHEALREAGIACEAPNDEILAIPLRGREEEVGVIWAFAGGRSFEPAEMERVRLISSHAEVALHNAERYNRAKERAFIDDVTEVYNARFLHQQTEREIQRAERYEKDLCVLFLDLDRFKLVNDEYGHLVGSQTLRRLSQLLQQCIRQVDTLARYGGDEFTILLVDTDIETGLAVAERIRKLVADALFEGSHGEPIRLTISIGVAAYPAHADSREGVLDAADKAMYRAKSQGRDCVCSAAELTE